MPKPVKETKLTSVKMMLMMKTGHQFHLARILRTMLSDQLFCTGGILLLGPEHQLCVLAAGHKKRPISNGFGLQGDTVAIIGRLH